MIAHRFVKLALLCLFLVAGLAIANRPVAAQGDGTLANTLKVPFQFGLEKVAEGFELPTFIGAPKDGSGRLFVVEKPGRIQIVKDGKVNPKPFLDITKLVNAVANERGLLSVAFHPDYANNGLFFVYYTDARNNIIIARYKASSNPDLADVNSAKIILTVEHPTFPNHNGGQLQFGPDGFLYIGTGDGGGAGDPWKAGQNRTVLLAKILRIDVNQGDTYGIPADNPYVNDKSFKPEIWAYGLRNPWRFSFDRATGDLYIADVGQNLYEEIDFQKAGTPGGVNYGWSLMEGLHCYQEANCSKTGLTLPIVEYNHQIGISISGGYVYRGTRFPKMQGYYFFGDYGTTRLWALKQNDAGKWETAELTKTGFPIASFGEDQAGEVYVTDYGKGAIYHLVDKSAQS